MVSKKSDAQSEKITSTLLPFLLITFGLTWGLAAIFILFSDQVTAIFSEMGLSNPLNNPIWPDAQPWDNLLITIIAVIVVRLKRHTMFQRASGVTGILMPENPYNDNDG